MVATSGRRILSLPIYPRNQDVLAAEHYSSNCLVPAVDDPEPFASPFTAGARPRLGGCATHAALHCTLNVSNCHAIAAG